MSYHVLDPATIEHSREPERSSERGSIGEAAGLEALDRHCHEPDGGR